MKNVLVAIFVLLCSMPIFAQDQEPAETSEEEKMMAAWLAAGTPGAEHAKLAAMTGEWDVTGRFWMEPGADPMESKGVASREMILGGRVLAESFKSEFMGMPFEGYGMAGYDNLSGRWWNTWADTMMTGLLISEGQCTDDMKVCTFMAENVDPATGRMMYTKTVARTVSKDKEVVETWLIGPTGEEMKNMELVYTRKK